MTRFGLWDRVSFTPPRGFRTTGQVRGVTHESEPHYDILADDGIWHSSIPAADVEPVNEGEEAA